MARYLFPAITGVVWLTLLAGCQSNGSALVDNIPAPNFNGPVILAPAVAPTIAPTSLAPVKQSSSLKYERAWIPNAPARKWQWIVIHHSATPSGSASVFDKMHREKGWDELGYHFVIGNGTDSGNGQVEVGSRWPKQKWGAHAKTPDNRYNDFGIGICLVGNFEIERPTPQQMQALSRLTAYLMSTYHIPPANVIRHKDTKSTDCPGKYLDLAQVRRMSTQLIADAGLAIEDAQTAGASELLEEITSSVDEKTDLP